MKNLFNNSLPVNYKNNLSLKQKLCKEKLQQQQQQQQ